MKSNDKDKSLMGAVKDETKKLHSPYNDKKTNIKSPTIKNMNYSPVARISPIGAKRSIYSPEPSSGSRDFSKAYENLFNPPAYPVATHENYSPAKFSPGEMSDPMIGSVRPAPLYSPPPTPFKIVPEAPKGFVIVMPIILESNIFNSKQLKNQRK